MIHPGISIRPSGSPEIALKRFTLANGLTLFVLPDHRLPIVSLQIHYKVGSRHELPGITGISHLFEHLMFRGTKTLGRRRVLPHPPGKGRTDERLHHPGQHLLF